MRFCFLAMTGLVLFGAAVGTVLAEQPIPASAVEQPDFSPPPVPEFMLRKPEKPLTLEEMKAQADAASRRVRKDKGETPAEPNEKK